MKKRAKVVEGTQEVTVDEIKDQLSNIAITDINSPNAEKGIPEFWSKCFKNSSQFGTIINKNDEKVLSHLKDVTCDLQETGSYTLNFIFETNQYFDHPILKREFLLDVEKQSISKIVSTKIQWKSEELNPTIEKKKKVVKNKKTKVKKEVTKVEEVPSFFTFFKDYDILNAGKHDHDHDDEEEEHEEDEGDIIEEEYDLGNFIKEEMIPYAIEYYLGIIKDDEFEGEGEDFEDEEDEEDEPAPKKKGKK